MSFIRKEGTTLRIGQMYRIKNKWIRRAALIGLFPFLFSFNIALALMTGIAISLIASIFQIKLYSSFVHYWNSSDKIQ